MKEVTVKLLTENITEEQIDKLDMFIVDEFNSEPVISSEEYVEEGTPVWLSLKDVLSTIKELQFYSIDTKYLHIYLDTRFINNDFQCTVKDRKNNQYLTLEDLKERRFSI